MSFSIWGEHGYDLARVHELEKRRKALHFQTDEMRWLQYEWMELYRKPSSWPFPKSLMKISLIRERQHSCEPKWSRKSRPRSEVKRSFEHVRWESRSSADQVEVLESPVMERLRSFSSILRPRTRNTHYVRLPSSLRSSLSTFKYHVVLPPLMNSTLYSQSCCSTLLVLIPCSHGHLT